MKREITAALAVAALNGTAFAASQESGEPSQSDSQTQAEPTETQSSGQTGQAQSQSEGQAQEGETQASDSGLGESTQPQSQGAQGQSSGVLGEQSPDQMLVGNLYDSVVVNPDQEEVGSINDVILGKDGELVGIVVGVGGFLGMGEKNVGLAWNDVDYNPEERIVVAKASKKQLEEAPAFKSQEQIKIEQARQQQQQQLQQQQQELQQGSGQQTSTQE